MEQKRDAEAKERRRRRIQDFERRIEAIERSRQPGRDTMHLARKRAEPGSSRPEQGQVHPPVVIVDEDPTIGTLPVETGPPAIPPVTPLATPAPAATIQSVPEISTKGSVISCGLVGGLAKGTAILEHKAAQFLLIFRFLFTTCPE